MKPLLLALFLCTHVQALTINLTFIGGDPPTNFVGRGDPAAIIRAAADMWELCILDEWVLDLTWQWVPLEGTAGNHAAEPYTGRQRNGHMNFDSGGNPGNVPLYYDPTPYSTEEFTKHTILMADYGGGQIVVGRYWNLPNDPDANAGVDLFALAMHEIGHGLGLHSANSLWAEESADEELIIADPLPFAGTKIPFARNCCEVLPHIRSGMGRSVMGGLSGQERRAPSYVDLLAQAHFSSWRKINWDLRPIMAIALAEGGLRLSWSAHCSDWLPWQCPAIGEEWQPVQRTPALDGSQQYVIVQPERQGFYRLQR